MNRQQRRAQKALDRPAMKRARRKIEEATRVQPGDSGDMKMKKVVLRAVLGKKPRR